MQQPTPPRPPMPPVPPAPTPAAPLFPPAPQRFTLKEEVRSSVRPAVIYGAKNSTVTLISQSETGDMSIVERADGERFSVRTEKLNPLRGHGNGVAETSRAAYHSVLNDGTIAGQQNAILTALAKHGNGNAYKISQNITGIGKHEVGRRISELLTAKAIELTGEKAPTDTGRSGRVYSITDEGRKRIS